MGRNTTGIYHINECFRMDLKELFKAGALSRGETNEGKMTFSNGHEMSYKSNMAKEPYFIELKYTVIKKEKESRFEYKIYIDAIPSNLGKGMVHYFLCPFDSDVRCRTLYMAYGVMKFYSREFYKIQGHRIYYPSQALSKDDYMFHAKHKIMRAIDATRGKKNVHRTHKGEPTKFTLNYAKLWERWEYWNRKCEIQFQEKIYNLTNW